MNITIFTGFAALIAVCFLAGNKLLQQLDLNSKHLYQIVRKHDDIVVCSPLPKTEAKKVLTKICKQYEEWAFNELSFKHNVEAQKFFDWRNSLKLVKIEEVDTKEGK